MKLYATITSERASKGQGGNKELKIVLTIGKVHQYIGYIHLYEYNGDAILKWCGNTYQHELGKYEIPLNGKKQKSENWQDIDIQSGELISRHQ